MMQTQVVTKQVLEPKTEAKKIEKTYPQINNPQRNAQQRQRHLKAMVDYIVVGSALLFIWPLLLLLAVAVRLDSPGPIIYRRRVLGKDGHVFYAFKFRTMFVNGDMILAQYPKLRIELNNNYKLKCDPRVTRVGRLLRKFSLDELPQLFNILLQDMSIVGPRIITPEEIAQYGEHGDKLMSVMPGLTGLWQVSGRSDTSYNERVELDMSYIQNWSIQQDIKILLKTIPAVLKGDGAY
jgi:lipopolysaccharide/colanic/teichoic acid biosynthesis glycosyltransferase